MATAESPRGIGKKTAHTIRTTTGPKSVYKSSGECALKPSVEGHEDNTVPMKLYRVGYGLLEWLKNDMYDMNLRKCGSDPIYSDENTCTQKETVVKTINVVEDNASKRRVQLDSRHPECIQGAR